MATGDGYAAILARLRAPQLRLHCDEALRLELVQAQLRLQDVCAAMTRLREVGQAAKSLGSEDGAALSVTLVLEIDKTQRDLGRAIAAFGSTGGGRSRTAQSSTSPVCCKCGGVETAKPSDEWETRSPDEPLLATPNAAALSPPRRRKAPPPARSKPKLPPKPKPAPRRKLVIPRKANPVPDDDDVKDETKEVETKEGAATEEAAKDEETTAKETKLRSKRSASSSKKRKQPPPKKEAKPNEAKDDDVQTDDVKTDESDDFVIVEDDQLESDDDDDDDEDVRTRLQHRIDACWPLATELGALEMPQRRGADYADLVRRVCALFRTLLACDVESMASRSMRSVLVKARDSLAVAVSLLSLHEVTDTNARTILALVKAVDAASYKHPTLQKHVAPFRNSLADFEVALLTRNYAKLSSQQPPAKESKGGGGGGRKKQRQ